MDSAPLQPPFFSEQVRAARRFYLELAPDPAVPLAVVCGGREECAPDYVIDRQDFPYQSLEFVSRGRGTLVLDGVEAELVVGVAYTYGPGVPHRIVADPNSPLEKYFVDFSGPDAQSFMASHALGPGVVRRAAAPSEVQTSLDALIRHGVHSSGIASPLCDALMRYILLLVASSASLEATRSSPAYATYVRCREHIREHCLRLHSLDEVAKETFVDKTYLCRMFQRFDQQTPYQLLTRLKMNTAAELLEDPNLLIKQVAANLGYADAFHFSRTFKGVFGVSPQAFRQLRL